MAAPMAAAVECLALAWIASSRMSGKPGASDMFGIGGWEEQTAATEQRRISGEEPRGGAVASLSAEQGCQGGRLRVRIRTERSQQ